MRCPSCGSFPVEYHKPVNALIAEALGWRTWEGPNKNGAWFQERAGKPGFIEVVPLIDYVSILKNDVKMFTGDQLPKDNANVYGKSETN
jgi:hypothetical protein